MSRWIAGIFNTSPKSPPATSLRVSTALQGTPITLFLGGQQRLGVNLVNYFNFSSQTSSGGGKGGSLGGGKGQPGTTYTVSFVAGVCEGPIAAYVANWVNGVKNFFTQSGFEVEFLGDYSQLPWVGVTTFDPTQALSYRGIAYVAALNFNLGSSPSLPQLNFEVLSLNNSNIVPGQPDGDPTIALTNFLTNPFYGVGFPPARLGPLAGSPGSWQQYCKAVGFGVSPVLAAATSAASAMDDIVKATNSAACWQNGILNVVPYGDAPIQQGTINTITENYQVPAPPQNSNVASIKVGNVGTFVADLGVNYFSGVALTLVPFPPSAPGTYSQIQGTYYFWVFDHNNEISITYTFATAASYVPDTVNLYDFTINDFLTNQGTVGTGMAPGNSPVSIVRKPRDQMMNVVKVEYLDRNNAYNPVDIEVKDQAAIATFRKVRPTDIKQMHFFCLASAAVQSATLQLTREQIAKTYQWTVGKHFSMILELMKIVTLTLPSMGMAREAVRIIEIQENTDQTLTITAEEFNGTASAPVYGTEVSLGHQPNYNADPGFINTPLLFEPTDELGRAIVSGGGLMLVVAVSGANPLWGGCNVWISYDGLQYTEVGSIEAPARMGVLTAPLPSVTASQTGQTIDAVNTLAVDLTESFGQLNSVSQIDATNLNTKSFVGPLLGQPNAGNGEVVSYQTALLTAQNKYSLSYLIRGAFGSEAEITTWPAGTGFARIDSAVLAIPFDKTRIGATVFFKFPSFNIYKGAGAVQTLSEVAPYSYTIQGIALSSPLPNLNNVSTVFTNGRLGVTWDEIDDFRGAIRVEIRQGSTFNGAVILGTVAHPPYYFPGNGTYWLTAWCQPASGLIVRSETPVSMVVTGATVATNSVDHTDLKAANWPGVFTNTQVDVSLNAVRTSPGQTSGTYAPALTINVGRPAPVTITISLQGTGVPAGQNILTIGNILTDPDVLGASVAEFVTVFASVAVSQDGITYAPPVKYAPGDYFGMAFQFVFTLESVDPNTIAYLLSAVIDAQVPARVDHILTNATLSSGGLVVSFTPDGSGTPAAFNGGPNGATVPHILATWGDEQAGDVFSITSLTLSGATFQILNGGVGVTRNKVNIIAEGF